MHRNTHSGTHSLNWLGKWIKHEVQLVGRVVQGPMDAIAFSKVYIFIPAETKQNIFTHTSVYVSFSPMHTKTPGNDENDGDLDLRMR